MKHQGVEMKDQSEKTPDLGLKATFFSKYDYFSIYHRLLSKWTLLM